MSISIIQAIILGLFASLSSMPGMGSSSIGNYTLGRPLVGGLDADRLHRSGNSGRNCFS